MDGLAPKRPPNIDITYMECFPKAGSGNRWEAIGCICGSPRTKYRRTHLCLRGDQFLAICMELLRGKGGAPESFILRQPGLPAGLTHRPGCWAPAGSEPLGRSSSFLSATRTLPASASGADLRGRARGNEARHGCIPVGSKKPHRSQTYPLKNAAVRPSMSGP